MNEIDKLKEALVLACRIAGSEGLVYGFGHISARIPGTDRYLIPRTVAPADTTAEDILTVDLQGTVVEGKGTPRFENWIHTCIYRVRPDVGSVSHVHPEYVIILSSTGTRIQPVHNFGAVFPQGVGLYRKAGLIDNEELGAEVADALGMAPALMLRGHGAVVVGADVVDATLRSIYLEEAARIQYRAIAVGTPIFYTEEESEMIQGQVHNPKTIPSTWQFYVNRAMRKR